MKCKQCAYWKQEKNTKLGLYEHSKFSNSNLMMEENFGCNFFIENLNYKEDFIKFICYVAGKNNISLDFVNNLDEKQLKEFALHIKFMYDYLKEKYNI